MNVALGHFADRPRRPSTTVLALLTVFGFSLAVSEAQAQLRSARGSNNTLSRLGRETRFDTGVGRAGSVLESYTQYQSQASRFSPSGTTARSPGGLFTPSRRKPTSPASGASSTSSTRPPLFVPIRGSASMNFVPLQSLPRSGSMAIQAIVDRVSSNPNRGSSTSFSERQTTLYNSGIGRLNAVVFTPEILVRDRANPLPASVINASAQGGGTTMRYEGLVWEGDDPLNLPEVQPVSAEVIWADKLASSSEINVAKGREAMKAGKFFDAAIHYRDAEIASPNSAESRAGQLCAQLAAQQYESAIITLERILQRDGQSGFSADLKLAELWPDGDQLRMSITASQTLVLTFPTRAHAKGLLVYLRWLSGDRTEALRLAREVKTMPVAGAMAKLEDFMNQAVRAETAGQSG